MKAFVLAEKPSVGREIARVLGCSQKQKNYFEGPQYIVSWALGHLVELAEPEDYDPKYKTWNLTDLPIIPDRMELKVIKETSQQFRTLSQLAKRNDISEMIIATDAGREGELVARWILKLLHWKKPIKRLWVSSQTDQAIKEGFSRLKAGEDFEPLYQSAVCRAEADWLIGLNVTRALTSKHNAQLSAGRVQTPTLGMVIQRENEIRSFQPKPYWKLEADLGPFQAVWKSGKNQDYRIWEEGLAQNVHQKIKGNAAAVADLTRTEKAEPHPLAYDLTELQRDANRRFGFSAKHTLNTLQRLYERHKLVTYPRTDSRHLSSDMVYTLRTRLQGMASGPYGQWVKPLLQLKELPITKRIVDDQKVTDHHAIIPTEERPRLQDLNQDEKKIYGLIAQRFISLFYPAYRYDSLQIRLAIAGESFHARGRAVKEAGWKEIYGMEREGEDSSSTDEQDQNLPSLKIGDTLDVKETKISRSFTEPPLRLTEAELLTRMEKNKLGTPATRADIIEKLLQTETIERQGNRLYPTPKGWQLMDLAAEELRSAELTAEWEQELERIARGKGNPKEFLDKIRKQTKKLVEDIKEAENEYKPHNITGSKCPECGEFLREIKGKKGKSLICPSQSCSYRRSAENKLLNKRCPQCKKKMEFRTGKAGPYAQCKPCNVIEMLEENGKGKSKRNKREDKQLIQKYSGNESLGSSLGDALKAALENKKE